MIQINFILLSLYIINVYNDNKAIIYYLSIYRNEIYTNIG